MSGSDPRPHLGHRPDIDGLRAVAVLLVLAFHLFPSRVRGGFVGVDVFFVISGYLISGIVFSGLEDGTFRLARFYDRRIRRILPSLLVVTSFALAAGVAALFADELAQLGKHVAAGAAFVLNFVLRAESGYFDAAAATKPLLHLWSLSVEEQFYLFWPLALVAVHRLRRGFLPFTVVTGLLSLGAGLYLDRHDPVAAFYWPFGRIWELMIGGLLAWIDLHRPGLLSGRRGVRALIGCILIGVGVAVIGERSPIRNWLTLLPTVGTALLISAGPDAWPNRWVLSSRPLVWVGLISYPLYLWHWLLLVLARTLAVDEPGLATRLALGLLSVLLAWLTYALVERPLRSAPSRWVPVGLVVALVTVGAIGLGIWRARGLDGLGFRGGERGAFSRHFENALPEWSYFEREGILRAHRYDCDFYDIARFREGRSTHVPVSGIPPDCHVRDPRLRRSVFLWGDSHARQLRPGLEGALPPDWQVLQVATSRCIPDAEPRQPETHYCGRSNRFALRAIAEARPDVVVLGRRWGHDLGQARAIAGRLRSLGVKKVILVGPVPQWTRDLPRLVARSLWPDTPRRTLTGMRRAVLQTDAALATGAQEQDDVAYASPVAYFCDADGCLVYLGDDRMEGLTAFDYGHLTLPASRAFGRDVLVPLIVGGVE